MSDFEIELGELIAKHKKAGVSAEVMIEAIDLFSGNLCEAQDALFAEMDRAAQAKPTPPEEI